LSSNKAQSQQEISHLESELKIYKEETSKITALYSKFKISLEKQISDGN